MSRSRLLDILRQARDLGFLGPGAVDEHLAHAEAFLAACAAPDRAVDLGSGAGVPGLVLAVAWPDSSWVLLDAHERRTAFLGAAVAELNLADRVTVWRGRAEDAGRDTARRGAFDLATARAFGPPAVTAELGSPFLRAGGRLVVSEPPMKKAAEGGRWDPAGLARLGLVLGARIDHERARVQVLNQATPCPDAFPRRTGIPAKRPLW